MVLGFRVQGLGLWGLEFKHIVSKQPLKTFEVESCDVGIEEVSGLRVKVSSRGESVSYEKVASVLPN